MNKIFLTDGKFSPVKVAIQIAVVAALVVGLLAFIGNNKTIKINVDGRMSSVQTFGGKVDDVVKGANIELNEGDEVFPSRDSAVDNGAEVTIQRRKSVDVNLDGKMREVATNASTVGELTTELKVPSAARVSLPAETDLEVDGTAVDISTPKAVNLVVRGKASKLTTTAATVADVLKEAKVSLARNDVLAVPATSAVTANMTVKISNIDRSKTAQVTESVPFETVKTNTASLYAGESKVAKAGVNGSRVKTFRLVIVDGKEASRTLVTNKVTAQPVTEEISVGTKQRPAAPAPSSSGSNTGKSAPAAMNGGMWDRIAQCEATGNWSINTGNGYYGGLQFDIQTWLGAGGGAYAPNASLATREQQIDIANRVYAQRGLQPWGCGWAAGG